MADRINLAELRERADERIADFAGGGMGVNPRSVLAFIQAVEAARAYRRKPRFAISQHGEQNEIECSCGFISDSADYGEARRELLEHIQRADDAMRAGRIAVDSALDVALDLFDFGDA